MCEMQFYLKYVLCLEDKSGKKAELGNVFHKVMECLAKGKLKYQETGLVGGYDIGDEYIGEFIPEDIFDNRILSKLCKLSHQYYSSISEHVWTDKDLILVIGWVKQAVEYSHGSMDPRNSEVLFVEKYFDFEIDRPWAKYSFKIGDKLVEGNLALRGAVDLIMKIDDDTIEVLDYKTGKRLDWATGQEKTHEKLKKDPQLLLYFWALRQVLPNIKHFIFTIFYVNDGGAFTMSFDDESYKLAEKLIKDKFEYIKNLEKPALISDTNEKRQKNFRCKSLCHFAKNNHPGTEMSICEFFQNKIIEDGIEKVTHEHTNWKKFGQYQDGGGQKDVSNKQEKR